jgi:hypothetical protein
LKEGAQADHITLLFRPDAILAFAVADTPSSAASKAVLDSYAAAFLA